MRGKPYIMERVGRNIKVKVRYLVVAVMMALCSVGTLQVTNATGCPELRVVFARGSGGELNGDQNFIAFRDAIVSKLNTTSIRYEVIDLDYPAIGISDPKVLAGAYFGAGEAYEFGKSVKSGVEKLDNLVNGGECPGTKYVVGGYSQGAMVVSRTIPRLRSERVIYAATFGDPKIYLPEGAGLFPDACKERNLSDYRMYVPDCYAYRGMLGANEPYEPADFIGKVGTWCNKGDIFCSSHFNISDHVAYVREGLYEDASKVIFDKICRAFEVTNTVSSPHDTVILIDSTGSMDELINQYRNEAIKLAEKTLDSGGRIALYDYRDYQEGYVPRQWCSFETCNMEAIRSGLAEITTDGGDDTPESLLGSSLHIMQELNWKQGSTKSIVVLTDAGYHEPDFDIGGTTKLDVVRMSKQIDPVNFYVVTDAEVAPLYESLAAETGGRVVATTDDLTELTNYIMARYDTLPRVEEVDVTTVLPILSIDEVAKEDSSATVKFTSTSGRALVVLNDAMLGVVEGDTVTIGDLNPDVPNRLMLVPLGDDVRGDGVEVVLNGTEPDDASDGIDDFSDGNTINAGGNVGRGVNNTDNAILNNERLLPKAPNTGRL